MIYGSYTVGFSAESQVFIFTQTVYIQLIMQSGPLYTHELRLYIEVSWEVVKY